MKTFAPATCTSKLDVLLYGHVDLELAEQIQGIPKVWGPMPFKKTAQTPSFGTPAASDDITGGIGWRGTRADSRIRRAGRPHGDPGNGSMLPIEGGIVRGVASRFRRRAAQFRGRRRRWLRRRLETP